MVRPCTLPEPSVDKVKELQEIMEQYPDLRPRLTFPFSLSSERQCALELIQDPSPGEDQIIELLQSDDYIIQKVGLYLLRYVDSISVRNRHVFLKILDDISTGQYPDMKIVVAKSLAVFGDEAKFIYEKLIYDEDHNVRTGVVRGALHLPPQSALCLLEQLINDGEGEVRAAVAMGLSHFGELGLAFLSQMMIDRNPIVRNSVIQALSVIGSDEAVQMLSDMLKFVCERRDSQIPILKALGDTGNQKALDILRSSGDKVFSFRHEIQKALSLYALDEEGAVQIVHDMVEAAPSDHDRDAIIFSIRDMAPEIKGALLRELALNCRVEMVKALALDTLRKEKSEMRQSQCKDNFPWLLTSQKAMFHTRHTEETLDVFHRLEVVMNDLRSEYGEAVVGLVVVGSFDKGYFQGISNVGECGRKSDVDWGIITTNSNSASSFRNISGNRYLNDGHLISVVDGLVPPNQVNWLYRGIFIGDRQALHRLQVRTFENMDEDSWDRVRKEIEEKALNLKKAALRYDITDEELEFTQQIVALRRVPLAHR